MGKKKDQENGLHIEGGVHTDGGDFVGRDKVVRGGDHSVVIGGNAIGNVFGAQGDPQASLEALRSLLAEIRAAVPQTDLDADTAEAVEGDFEVLEKQLARPEPKKTIVLPKLESIAGMLTTAAAAGEAVQKLKPMIEQAIEWVKLLF